MRETDIKYLAGFFDADGSSNVAVRKQGPYRYATLRLQIKQADSVDRDFKVMEWIKTTFGGSLSVEKNIRNGVRFASWEVASNKDVEKLVPRLIKHLVVKGKSLQSHYELWRSHKSKDLDDVLAEEVKQASYTARRILEQGPVKPKNHPTWAWLAGFIDGDGCFFDKVYTCKEGYKAHQMFIQIVGHKADRASLDLLYKAFGGNLRDRGDSQLEWKHNLGPKDRSFAKKFLSKYLQHGKLKRHKAEQILANHSQRPIEETPKGEVMAQPV